MNLDKLKEKIKELDVGLLQIISDFDNTLTYSTKENSSLIATLRDNNVLSNNYSIKAKELFNHYHPYEHDINLDLNTRKKMMSEWWEKHFQLLINTGFSKNDIYRAIDGSGIKLRPGVKELFDILFQNNIPIIIMSAGGLGKESIRYFLSRENINLNNVYIVANDFIWDDNGMAIGIKKPIVHSLNKDRAILNNYDFYDKIKNRRDIIVLGDSLEDADMSQGFDYNHVIKICLFRSKNRKYLNQFKNKFDFIVTDNSFNFLNESLLELLAG